MGSNSQRGKRREGLERKGKREGDRGDHFSFSLFGLGFRVRVTVPQIIPDRKLSPFAVGDHLRYCTVRKNSKQQEANECNQVLTYQVFYRHLRILGDH